MWESVAALKARLAAIKIIYTSPYNYEVEEEDADPESQAFLNNSQSTIIYQNITPISFAQLDLSKVEKNDNLSAQLTKSRAEKTNSLKQAKNAVSEASAKNLSEGFDGSRVSFASPTMNEKEHPLAAMQDEMESLSEMNEVESLVSEAMDTHNLITDLPQYKQQAESYMQAIEYHKRSLEKLKVSEKCAIKYLGKYFKDPHLVWLGKLPIEDATNHDLRNGVSGWAYNAFELLKSGEATETIEAFSIAKEEMNKEKTTDEEDEKAYLHDQEALNKKIENMKSQQRSQEEGVVKDYITAEELLKISDDPQKGLDMGELDENGEFIRDENGKVDLSKTRFGGPNAEALVNESMSASKKGTVTEETRKASMLSWQIGAEASEMLGNPDYKWGSEYTDKKLIWNDTKRFYRKYLELKYNNILGYIKSVSSMDIMEIIAGKLVGKKVSISNTEYQKQRRAQVDAIVKEIKNGLATEREAALANIADGFKSELSKADKEACPDIDIEEYKVCLEAKKTKFTNIAKKVCSKDFAKGIEEKNYRDDPKKTNKDNTEIKKDFNSKIAHQSLACLEVAQELAKVNADIIHQNILEAKDEIIATKAAKEDEVIDAQLAAATAPVVFTDDETKISTTKITGLVKDKLSENIASNTASKISSDVEIKVKEEGIEAKKVEIAAETSYSTMLERAIKKKKLELQEKAAPVDADEKASAEEQSDSRISALEASLGAVNEKSKAFDEIRNYIITATKDNPVEGLKDPASINAAIFSMHADIKGLMGKLQDKAYEVIITNGYNEMLKLGDDLYSEANHGKLVKMHTDIIKKLKSTKLTFTITNTALKGLIGSSDLNILDELLSSIDFIGSVNLSKDMIEAEQEGFFVGATPSERDLKAPMRLTGFDQPPVREIFHFDAEDFKHVKEEEQAAEEAAENDDDTKPDWIEKVLGFAQEAAEKISKQKRSIDKQFFLDYGGKIPKIWQVMLSDYPFVETRYSLKEALDDYENGKSSGDDKCARTTFSRGGIMPCLYGYNEKNKQYDYVLDITQNSKYIHYKADATHNKNLGACAGIKAKLNPAGTPPGIEPYHEFWKVFLNNGTGGADALASCEPSELGMLLEADKHNNLFLRKTVYKNFNRINKQNASENKKPIEKMSKVKRRNLVAAQQSEFSRNQVGDFLKQAESEKMLKENLEEVKAGYEKSMEVLTAIFIEN